MKIITTFVINPYTAGLDRFQGQQDSDMLWHCLSLTSSSWTSKVRAQIISPLLHSVVPEVCTSCLVRLTPLLTRVRVALLKVTLQKTCKSSKALNRGRKSRINKYKQ